MTRFKHIVCFLAVFALSPVHGQISNFLIQESKAREEFWQRILQTKPTPLPGGQLKNPDHYYGDKILGYSSDPQRLHVPEARYARPVQIPEDNGPPTFLNYHVYMSQQVYDNPNKLKGVIIKAYGAMIRTEFRKANIISDERLLAAQGYLVYSLNVRGTKGYGKKFLYSISKSEGILSQIRDICYFATLIRNPSLKDALGNRPALSFKIPYKAPILFKGESYGGEVGLMIATTLEAWALGHLSICPATTFDGIISGCAISEQYLDLCSLTTVARERLAHFQEDKTKSTASNVEWFPNCYPGVNLLNDPVANEKYSPLYRTHHLMRPVYLAHGLLDANVSPLHSLLFQEAARESGKDHLIFPYYDCLDDHNMPTKIETFEPYYETLFRFLDLTRNLKETHQVLQPSSQDQQTLFHFGYQKFRALNPDAFYPDYKFIHTAYETLLKDELYPSNFSYAQLWRHVTNIHWNLFLKAILFLNTLEMFGSKDTLAIEKLQNQEGMTLMKCYHTMVEDIRIGNQEDAFQNISNLNDFFDAYTQGDSETGKDLLFRCLKKTSDLSTPQKEFKRLEGILKKRFFLHLENTDFYKDQSILRAPILDF